MKMPQIELCIYFFLQIIVISLCNENTLSEGSSENTADQEIIDPHSFYYNRHRKEMEKPVNGEKRIVSDTVIESTIPESMDSVKCDCDKNSQDCKDEIYEVFYKRLVNMLLSHITITEENEIVKGIVHFQATSAQMEALRDFGNGKVLIRTVDSILSDIIRTPTTTFYENAITLSESLLSIINTHRHTCIGILVTISILWVSRYISWTRGAIIFLIIDLIFVISFFMTWYQLVKEAEIKQTAKQMMYTQMPIECQPEKMGMMQYIASKFFSRGNTEECEKYVEAMIINPVAQVTPAQALSHLCTNFILQPVSLAGHAIGNFIENCTEKTSWPIRWIVTLVLFIGVAFFISTLAFSLFGGSLGFGIGPLFHFTLSGAKNKEKKRLSNAQPRERIQLIREVPTNITIQRIESDSTSKENTTQIVKSDLNKKPKDAEALPQTASALDYFDQAKGDSAIIQNIEESVRKIELSDKEKSKTQTTEEIGSGDG